MTGEFKYLFTPLQIGPMTVRNRVMSVGHGTLMAKDNMPTEQFARYHAERAKGGVGLIELEATYVHRGSVYFDLAGIYDDRFISGFKLTADMVHEHGAKIICQIGHAGRNFGAAVHELPLWSASAVPGVAWGMPKAMEIEEIKWLVNAYAEAARRIKEAGLDGVTIHSAYGEYGLAQFMSPYANKRTDEYGGTSENRMRIVMEVIDAVRGKVGNNFVVGIQISGDEFTPTGLTVPDYQQIAKMMDATGKIDFITVKGGTSYCINLIIPDMQHPLGVFLPLTAAIKEVVDKTKVVAQGRINDLLMAEKILADGHGDIIGMTRQQICDPETVNKAREGRLEDIRTCMACNQGCVHMFTEKRYITCVQNPAVGKEKELGLGTLRVAEKKKKIMVIGGGPAGMKTAEIAARRGHEVILYERLKELGGQVRIAAKASGRHELGESTRWLETQIKKLGVRINLGIEATAEMVLKENPEAVVIATGSSPTRGTVIGLISYGIEEIPGLDQDNVLDTWQILEDGKKVGERVLVVDDGELPGWKAISIAETLADQGKTVEIISPLPFVGMNLEVHSYVPMLPRFFEKNIKLTPFTILTSVSNKTISAISQGKPITIEGIDTVVLAGWHKPNEDLYFALKGKAKELHRVGDCIASRTILEAIREGEQVGRLL